MSKAQASETTVLYRQDGTLATITLNRPERLNAWNVRFATELREALERAAGDSAVRCLVITGAGRGFSAGADLKSMDERGAPIDGDETSVGELLRNRYHPVILAIRRMPKPVIAAVNGPAVGIGASLALACDLVLAAESAVFGMAFVRIGLIPDGGSTLLAPAAIGKARAFELSFLGESLPASRAAEWGLVNRVVPDGRLAAETAELAERLAAGPTLAHGGLKRALNASVYPDLEQQLELEAEIQDQLSRTGDFAEGVAAFVEKRQARFTGA